jgi:hypothetical protein
VNIYIKNKKNKNIKMGKIVRLTESDLVRIVKKVINESMINEATIMAPLMVGGKKYELRYFPGNDEVAYADQSNPGTGIVDRKLIDALNKAAGFPMGRGIPSATGSSTKGYILQHCSSYSDAVCAKLNKM